METEYKSIKTGELKALREEFWINQNKTCPLLGVELPLEEFVLDHKHRKNKSCQIGEESGGLIRMAIQRQCNALEGKIFNNWRRYGLDRFGISLPTFLRNLADYLERDTTNIIHPSEQPALPVLTKTSYNKLSKVITGKDKMPGYKGKQKLTKGLVKLFKKYNIEPEFYK